MATAHSPRSSLPDAPGPRGGPPATHLRTTVIAVGVSLAAVATVGVPFLVRDLGRSSATEPPPGAPTASLVAGFPDDGSPDDGSSGDGSVGDVLTGDVDGGGVPDTVTVSRGSRLLLSLDAGQTVHRPVPHHTRLVGLADVGTPGLAVVTSERGHPGRHLTVWTLQAGALAPLRTQHAALLADEPDLSVAWVSDHTLYDGVLDPLQSGADRVVVVSRAWHLRRGVLTPTGVGVRCWDRAAGTPPAPCPGGRSYAYDAGPRGDLPPLLPAIPRAGAGDTGVVTSNHDRWVLHRATPPGPQDAARYDLVLSGRGATRTVRIEAGWPPTLAATPVSVGELTDGVLVSQEGGDSDTWRVFVDWAGGIVELATEGPIPLGGGFASGGDAAYLSWQAADGRLYTRLGTTTPGRFRVWAWQPTGATASIPPTLVAERLGIVCIDETLQTYGTCVR